MNMTTGKWKVLHQVAGGDTFIRVARVKDEDKVVHTGNLEFQPEIFATDAEAEARVAELNKAS